MASVWIDIKNPCCTFSESVWLINGKWFVFYVSSGGKYITWFLPHSVTLLLFAVEPKSISSYLEASFLGGSQTYGTIISLMWPPVGKCISQSLDVKKAQVTGFITKFRLGALVLFLFALTLCLNLLRNPLSLLPDLWREYFSEEVKWQRLEAGHTPPVVRKSRIHGTKILSFIRLRAEAPW